MKLLGVVDKLGPLLLDPTHVLGGAERTAIIHLQQLQREFAYECRILTPCIVKRRMSCGGIPLESFRDLEEFKSMLLRYGPDVVLSSLDIIYESVRLSRSFDIPNIIFLDSYEYCEPSTDVKLRDGLSLSKSYPSLGEAEFAVKSADKVLACSNHLKRKIHRRHGVCAELLYPVFESGEVLLEDFVPDPRGYITGACGFPYKGVEIFYQLCRRFEHETFLIISTVTPEYQEKFRECENVILDPSLTLKESLGRSKIVLVPSQWEEPFGRIAVEAMVNGVPVLASYTGGLKEIVSCSDLGVRDFRNVEAWEHKLGQLLSSEAAYSQNSTLGKKLATKFLGDKSTRTLNSLIRSSVQARSGEVRNRRTVAFIGSTSKKTAFAIINAHLQAAFSQQGTYSILNCQVADETGLETVDYFIHHDFASEFRKVVPPKEGKWIVVRPWDFGKYPKTWVQKICRESDQLWVHSRWTKKLAVQGGIPSSHVKVIPLGFDEKTFKPVGGFYHLPTQRRFKFLFVGAAVLRKGLDILLKAYGEAFSRGDDVCLVIKGNSQDVFYTGIRMRDHILKLQQNPTYPEVVFIDDFLTLEQLAGLYRACDVGVFPYRAEGFAMPILEAMACGVPSIVPKFGACLDYCSSATSFLVPARRIALPVVGNFQFNTMGFEEHIEEVDFCEMPVAHLVEELRRVYHLPKGAIQKKAAEGVRASHEKFKWADSVDKIIVHLERLSRYKTPLRFRRKRAASEGDVKTFEIAKELFLNRTEKS